MKKILIFASGNGSNFQAIAEFFKDTKVECELLCNKKDAYVFERAAKLGVRAHFVPFGETHEFLNAQKPYDLYVLAGYMRVLPRQVLELGTFINIHPSLLPKYKGIGAIEQAYRARECECGVSVHYVNEEVDAGEIIEQRAVAILPDVTLETLEAQVHRVEHELYPKVIKKILGV